MSWRNRKCIMRKEQGSAHSLLVIRKCSWWSDMCRCLRLVADKNGNRVCILILCRRGRDRSIKAEESHRKSELCEER